MPCHTCASITQPLLNSLMWVKQIYGDQCDPWEAFSERGPLPGKDTIYCQNCVINLLRMVDKVTQIESDSVSENEFLQLQLSNCAFEKWSSCSRLPEFLATRGQFRPLAERPTAKMGYRQNPIFKAGASSRSAAERKEFNINTDRLKHRLTGATKQTPDKSHMPFSSFAQEREKFGVAELPSRLTRQMSGHFANIVSIIADRIPVLELQLLNVPSGLVPYVQALCMLKGFTNGIVVFRGLATSDISDLETFGYLKSKAERHHISSEHWVESAKHVDDSTNSPFISWTSTLQTAAEFTRSTVDPTHAHYPACGDIVAIAFIASDFLPGNNPMNRGKVSLGGVSCTEILTLGNDVATVFATLSKRGGVDKSLHQNDPTHCGEWALWPLHEVDEPDYAKFCSSC